MPTVFAVRPDDDLYQYLDLELTDLLDLANDSLSLDDVLEFSLRNVALTEAWVKPVCGFETQKANPKGTIPDVSLWMDASLVLSPKAFRLLGDSLKSYGEFLPLLVGEETYYIFNCMNVADVEEGSVEHEYEGDMKLGISKFAFNANAQDSLVFKTPIELCRTLYCNQRFKILFQKLELTGLIFDESLLLK